MIEILNFKPFEKNTLKGFLDLKMTNIGLTIKGCTCHQKDGQRWIGLPARPYEDEGGNNTWASILYFEDEFHKKFQRAALEALDAYRKLPEKEPPKDDIPF